MGNLSERPPPNMPLIAVQVGLAPEKGGVDTVHAL